MSPILIRILQLILSLSFLVMIHELGHFVFARIFKVRVSKFYMFFNPQISLLRAKKINGKWQVKFFARNVWESQKVALDAFGDPILWENDESEKVRKKYAKMDPLTDAEWDEIEQKYNFGRPLRRQGHPKFNPITDEDLPLLQDDDWRKYPETTEWGIGWVPLGGYCAIAGMVDETTTADQLQSEPKEWEYRAKSTWQRLPIIIGGVLVNIIGAFVIYAGILHHWGLEEDSLNNAHYGLYYPEYFVEQGFQQGDLIVGIDGKKPETRADLVNWILIDGGREIDVLRENAEAAQLDTVRITLPEKFDQIMLANQEQGMPMYAFPFVIDSVLPESPAAMAGLMKGDSLIAIDTVATPTAQSVKALLPNYALDSVDVLFVRNGQTETARLFLGDEATMDVIFKGGDQFVETVHIDYSFLEAIPAGIRLGWETLVSYVKQFRIVFSPEGAKQLGGFGTIGKLFPGVWDWHAFWVMTAFLSIILGFMNIIPIPGLDGGHVLFLLWEMITRKKPSDRFLEIVNTAGFYFLLALLIYANGNDLLKWILEMIQ